MSFPPGTKLVCIDATPIPILAGRSVTSLDFTFPNGFLEEGRIYCVSKAAPISDGCFGLHLIGLPILIHGTECNWHSSRFRKVLSNSRYSQASSEKKQNLTISTRASLTQFPEPCSLTPPSSHGHNRLPRSAQSRA